MAGLAEDAAAIRKLMGEDNPEAAKDAHMPIRMKPDMAGLFKEYREMRRKEEEKNAVSDES